MRTMKIPANIVEEYIDKLRIENSLLRDELIKTIEENNKLKKENVDLRDEVKHFRSILNEQQR